MIGFPIVEAWTKDHCMWQRKNIIKSTNIIKVKRNATVRGQEDNGLDLVPKKRIVLVPVSTFGSDQLLPNGTHCNLNMDDDVQNGLSHLASLLWEFSQDLQRAVAWWLHTKCEWLLHKEKMLLSCIERDSHGGNAPLLPCSGSSSKFWLNQESLLDFNLPQVKYTVWNHENSTRLTFLLNVF